MATVECRSLVSEVSEFWTDLQFYLPGITDRSNRAVGSGNVLIHMEMTNITHF